MTAADPRGPDRAVGPDLGPDARRGPPPRPQPRSHPGPGPGQSSRSGVAPPSGAVRPPGAIGLDRSVAVERLDLGAGSWVDLGRGWLAGADDLYDHLLAEVPWQTSRLLRYDHTVEERRLGWGWQRGTPLPHPALAGATRWLQARYRVTFDSFAMLQYRDGRDGQAFHRDTDMRWLDDTLIAVLSLGARRPWLLRPRSARHDHAPGRGAVHDLAPGPGDLLVMGGRAQADWEHSVPYRPDLPLGPRISIQWRFTRRTGRPFQGASYRAPLRYGG